MKTIEIRIQQWSEDKEDIIRDHGFLIETTEDYIEVHKVIREALKAKGYGFFGVN